MGLLDRFRKDSGASPDALTREALARVRALPDVGAAEAVDADTLDVTWVGGAPVRLSLGEVRGPWSGAQGFDRIEVMDAFIALLGPPPPTDADPGPDRARASDPGPADTVLPDPAAPVEGVGFTEPDGEAIAAAPTVDGPISTDRLVGVLRRLRPLAEVDPDTPVRWPVAGVLEAVAVVDGPGGIPVGRDDLRTWDVDAETVRRRIEAALAERGPVLDPIDPSMRAWVPTGPAGNLATWLCAPDALLAASGCDVLVALAPLPSELVVVDADDLDGLARILESTRQIIDVEPPTLWPAPLLLTADGVAPWEPPADHPAAGAVAELGTRVDP